MNAKPTTNGRDSQDIRALEGAELDAVSGGRFYYIEMRGHIYAVGTDRNGNTIYAKVT